MQRDSMADRRKLRLFGAQALQRLWRTEEGQGLIELALMVPIFTILVCYAVDFGFFFLVAASLNSAARNASEYAIQGNSSPAQTSQPTATAVSNLAIASIGLAAATGSTVSVRVCSGAVGVTMPANTAQCQTTSTGAGAVSGTADIDPESPHFQLNRVDVIFTVVPPVPMPASVFSALTFHRMVEMRRVQ